MTTVAEVKRWTKGILAEHPDLVLDKRYLYLRPMRHIYRAVGFLGSSQRTFPKPTATFGVLFTPPLVPMGNGLGHQLRVMFATDPNFAEDLAREVRLTLSPLRRMASIHDFFELTLEKDLVWAGSSRLSRAPELHAVVLAAMGNLTDACRVAEEDIQKSDEPRLLTMLAEGEELLTRRPRSTEARYSIERAIYWLRRLDAMKRLRDLAAINDRTGIATLLRSWEHDRVRMLGIEHLWEPTPFPLEEFG